MEVVQGTRLVTLGCKVEAIEAVGVLALVVGALLNQHLADLEVAVKGCEVERDKEVLI